MIKAIRAKRPDHKEIAAAIGARARERRKDLGVTQETTALLAGCDPRFIRDLEKGKPTLRLDKVIDVLLTLGLTITVENVKLGSSF